MPSAALSGSIRFKGKKDALGTLLCEQQGTPATGRNYARLSMGLFLLVPASCSDNMRARDR